MKDEWFDLLERHFKTQTNAARNLGISLVHYQRLRNHKHYGSKPLRKLIKLMVANLQQTC